VVAVDDPRADQDEVHEIVGVQFQDSAFPVKLRVGEILDIALLPKSRAVQGREHRSGEP
jgi:hypothetical protein